LGVVLKCCLYQQIDASLNLSGCNSINLLAKHRLGRLDDVGAMLHDWAGASTRDSQLELLAYARQLAGHLREYGVTAAAVDVGEWSEVVIIHVDVYVGIGICMCVVSVCLVMWVQGHVICLATELTR
jgi:hypothetical protein